ncbi:MAG: DUF192 domain-containing protein [Nitrospirae bacterium]|nr:DUF192 domain-containing protein [Nitrospirota bacterium]
MKQPQIISFFLPIILMTFFLSSSPALERKGVLLPDGRSLETFVADTVETRERGLMDFSRLNRNEGMLFIFGSNDTHRMWMKNMAFSIDIVWLDDKKRIVEILSSLSPCRREPCPTYGPVFPSKYVLELSDGASRYFNLRIGAQLKFP